MPVSILAYLHFRVNVFININDLLKIKTARNCLYNSGFGSRSRCISKNGNYSLFWHIADLFYSDQDFALYSLLKLTMDYINLKSYSKMKVKLAV